MIARLLAAVLVLVAAAGAQARRDVRGCAVCHGAEARAVAAGVHARAGIGCTTCHGGVDGPLEREAAHGDELRPLRGRLDSVESCGGCHSDLEAVHGYGLRTDQLPLYWTSAHGAALREDPGAPVATCVTCHGAHGVLPPSDTRSPAHPFRQTETCGSCHSDPALAERYGMDAGVVGDYLSSVHASALLERELLASPACTDCHGSHGATPPRVDEVGRVCGQCHAVVQDSFERSQHFPAAQRGEIEECVSCHGNHAIPKPTLDLLWGGAGGLCGVCHESGSTALFVADRLREDLLGLDASIEGAVQDLERAAERGLFIEEELGYLDDARGLRVRAAVMTHELSVDALDDVLNRGQAMVEVTRERLDVKARALRDRKIYTTIFFAVTVLLALVLLVYRRVISGRWDVPRVRPRREE